MHSFLIRFWVKNSMLVGKWLHIEDDGILLLYATNVLADIAMFSKWIENIGLDIHATWKTKIMDDGVALPEVIISPLRFLGVAITVTPVVSSPIIGSCRLAESPHLVVTSPAVDKVSYLSVFSIAKVYHNSASTEQVFSLITSCWYHPVHWLLLGTTFIANGATVVARVWKCEPFLERPKIPLFRCQRFNVLQFALQITANGKCRFPWLEDEVGSVTPMVVLE